jgi:hypothetical protein
MIVMIKAGDYPLSMKLISVNHKNHKNQCKKYETLIS